jgi:hypothetical protein
MAPDQPAQSASSAASTTPAPATHDSNPSPASASTPTPTPSLTPRGRRRLTRRRLIALAILGGAAAVAPFRFGFYDEADAFHDLERLSPTQAAILMALLEALLPRYADRSADALRGHVRFIDGYLRHVPPMDVRQLGLLLYAVEHATTPLELRLRRCSGLPLAERADYLRGWQRSGIGLRRLGLNCLTSLAFLACYRDQGAWAAIGYTGPVVAPEAVPAAAQARYERLVAPLGALPGSHTPARRP